MIPALPLLGMVALGACAWMLALYAVQRRTGDAGIVDVGWTFGLGVAALCYAAFAEGNPAHRAALAAVACPWSFRLGFYLLRDRVWRGEEDPRYAALRARWGAEAQRKFLILFLFQAGLIALLSLPYLVVALHPGPFAWWHGLGLLLGWGAIAGEAVADRQLARWRAEPAHRGRTCRAGLWGYSRHPNYFFEWLHWWSYALISFGLAPSFVAFFGPIIMFVFLYRVTGIPYTEAQALKSRGEDYRAYQRTVPPFLPWFPRKDSE